MLRGRKIDGRNMAESAVFHDQQQQSIRRDIRTPLDIMNPILDSPGLLR
jgi:hypothetical protein